MIFGNEIHIFHMEMYITYPKYPINMSDKVEYQGKEKTILLAIPIPNTIITQVEYLPLTLCQSLTFYLLSFFPIPYQGKREKKWLTMYNFWLEIIYLRIMSLTSLSSL